jgi:hypothetical protein
MGNKNWDEWNVADSLFAEPRVIISHLGQYNAMLRQPNGTYCVVSELLVNSSP